MKNHGFPARGEGAFGDLLEQFVEPYRHPIALLMAFAMWDKADHQQGEAFC